MILSYILICAAKVVVKAEPESDEFSHIKVGKTSSKTDQEDPKTDQEIPKKGGTRAKHYSKRWALIGSIMIVGV